MARKRASLRGRGNEILMGARQEERTETVDEPITQPTAHSDESQASSTLAQGPERGAAGPAAELADPGDGGQELSPEWVELLHEEALSASSGEPSELDGDMAADTDPSLPPLATTPARPKRPTDGIQASASPPAGEASPEAPESAPHQAAEVVKDTEGDAVPATEAGDEDGEELGHQPSGGVQVFEPQPDLNFQGSPVVAGASAALDEPTPPAPMYFESYGSAPVGRAYVPAPKEKPEATDTVMRSRLGGLLYEQATVKPSGEGLEPHGSKTLEMVAQETEGVETGRLFRPKESEILEFVGEDQRRALWDKAHQLYEIVPEVLSGDADQGRALRLLQEAQGILLVKPHLFDEAQFRVSQVQALVTWRRNVNRWSNTYGWGIFAYQVAWIAVIVLGVLTAERVANIGTSSAWVIPGMGDLSRLWSTMMWGGLGGVIGALYSLYWHVAKVRDFDKQFTIWYGIQPVLGLLLGVLVHLLIGPGFLTALGVNQQNQTVIGTLVPYAVACVVGFRQRSVLEMIDRAIQVITPSPRPQKNSNEQTKVKEPLDASV